MDENKNYWLYLESYTFIFNERNDCVIYNTLNGAYISCNMKSASIKRVIEDLLKSDGYCVWIDRNLLEEKELVSFLNKIKRTFSGDYVEAVKGRNMPFIFKPTLRLLDSFNSYTQLDDFKNNGGKILDYLNSVLIYLNTKCEYECDNCKKYFKQFVYCTKNSSRKVLSREEYIIILDRINKTGVSTINFSGGNILKYKYIYSLIDDLKKYNFKFVFNINIKHINSNGEKIINLLLNSGYFVNILFNNYSEFYFNLFKSEKISSTIVIESNKELTNTLHIVNNIKNGSIEVFPFYNKNDVFFRKNVFINISDIKSSIINKKSIFRHKIVNDNFFGKIQIMPNGSIYSNLNHKSIGNIFSNDLSLNEAVYKEIHDGKSWMRIRDRYPCSTCCNKYLCPSISNYEIIIKKNNLCNIIK